MKLPPGDLRAVHKLPHFGGGHVAAHRLYGGNVGQVVGEARDEHFGQDGRLHKDRLFAGLRIDRDRLFGAVAHIVGHGIGDGIQPEHVGAEGVARKFDFVPVGVLYGAHDVQHARAARSRRIRRGRKFDAVIHLHLRRDVGHGERKRRLLRYGEHAHLFKGGVPRRVRRLVADDIGADVVDAERAVRNGCVRTVAL